MRRDTVLVRGGGDLGSGTALRLWRAGFSVVILESERPAAVRRTVSFAEAVYSGQVFVEEAPGRLMTAADLRPVLLPEIVPVIVDPDAALLSSLMPIAVVDAILAKRNVGTHIQMGRCVVGLGPGFEAGRDVHAVVETNRGPNLGRVIWHGAAEPNTGNPGEVAGKGGRRVLRAPVAGILRTHRDIGDIVQEGEVVAEVSGEAVAAPFTSLVRGLAHDGLAVTPGMKIGDIDPRLDPVLCSRVSDKSLAVAGGVLEAILSMLYGWRR